MQPQFQTIPDLCTIVNTNLPRELQETVGMLAWDCIHPSQARIKLYVFASRTSRKGLRDMWTQRGHLTGPEIDAGLECMRSCGICSTILRTRVETGRRSGTEESWWQLAVNLS